VLNNDIVGGDRSEGRSPDTVRVFSEGIPLSASDDDVRLIRGLGGESDSPSRQIARYVAETASAFGTELKPTLVFRLDRYLRGVTTALSIGKALPGYVSRSIAKTTTISTRMYERKMGSNMATWQNLSIVTMWQKSLA